MGLEPIVGLGWLALQAGGALILLLLVVASLVRWPGLGLALAGAFTLILWEVPQAPQVAAVLGFSVYLDDLVVASLALAALVNVVRGPVRLRAIHVALLVLLLCFAGSVVAGINVNGAGAAVVEARGIVTVGVAALWAFTVRWPSPHAGERALSRYALLVALGLLTISAYHGARFGLGTADDFVFGPDGTVLQTSRILTSGQALVLGYCALYLLPSGSRSHRRLHTSIAIVALFTVALSQQRTAVLAIGVGLVLWFLRSRAAQKISAVLGLGAAALLVVTLWATGALGSLTRGLAESASSTGTYEGRVASWRALIQASVDHGAAAVLFGQPFGSGYGRFEGGDRWVEFAPHNWYVTVFLRAGLVGLVALVVFLFAALRAAWKLGAAPWVVATWVGLAVFGWAYSWPWYVMPVLVFGLALPIVHERHREVRVSSARTRALERRSLA